jgi:hypothetical protein
MMFALRTLLTFLLSLTCVQLLSVVLAGTACLGSKTWNSPDKRVFSNLFSNCRQTENRNELLNQKPIQGSKDQNLWGL